ncbi:cytochrome c oxidase, subunit VIb [Baffinella frigidus]|nr:cytochrome c oxidase, subunit VIb [Cryptophyta sp. CCMP2293]
MSPYWDLLGQVKGLPAGVKASDLLRSAPHDYHNPNMNQAKHCYAKYNEFFRCARPEAPPKGLTQSVWHIMLSPKFQGEDHKDCSKLRAIYSIMCPTDWTNKWDEEREAGTFAGPM